MRYGVLALLLLPPAPAPADLPRGIEKRIYESRRVDGDAPVFDGRLHDPVWSTVE